MKRPIRSLTLCLALTAALLAGCSQPEPEGKPAPEPYHPGPEVVTPAPVPEQPDPEPVDPADPEPAPEPVPEPSVPTEVPTPVEPGPAVPDPVDPAPIEQTGPTLKERLDRAYTYTAPDTGDVHYIEFKTVNGRLLAEVAVSPATGSRYSYWMAELEPVDGESLNNRSGEPCLIRSREFSGFSFDGAYWGPEEIISLIVDNEGILCRKGDRDYLLKSAEEIDEIHDETNMRRYLQLLDGPLMNRETLAASGIPGKREITGSQYGAHVYTWLELEENGLFWLMRKGLDTPTELYRGAYAVSADGTTIHYSAERLGYNTMPYLGKWKASVGKDDILRLTDEKGGQIRLSTIPGASVDFCPVGIEIPADEKSSLTFTYGDRDYYIPDYAPAVNAVVDTVPVGKYIVVEGHVGPKNGVYLIFNTETEEFEQMMSGHNLIWHSDDINTALFAFWGDIYTYDGKLVGSITQNAGEDAMIYDMEFSPDHQSVHVLVLTDDGGEMNVTFHIP